MARKLPTLAILYDFDKTLCTKDMQEYGFIPALGLSPEEFWEKANSRAEREKMDRVLAYMYEMVRQATAEEQSIFREDFVALGKDVEFFPGVEDWFARINRYGESRGMKVEHYIISSGLKEIIEGCPIAREFKEIYACEFHYNHNLVADWPRNAVNYTTKTQFLFRINKGALDLSDDEGLNRFLEEDDRPVPFRNMLYIGDGMTDVPCMKLVKANGGCSIAVYKRHGDSKAQAAKLLRDGRVNYIMLADYTEGGKMDGLVKQLIDKIAITDELITQQRRQAKAEQ